MFSEECFTLLILLSPYVITSQVLTRCHFTSRDKEFVRRFKVTAIMMLSNACMCTSLSTHIMYFVQQGLVDYTAKKIQICVSTLSSYNTCQLPMLMLYTLHHKIPASNYKLPSYHFYYRSWDSYFYPF